MEYVASMHRSAPCISNSDKENWRVPIWMSSCAIKWPLSYAPYPTPDMISIIMRHWPPVEGRLISHRPVA